MFHRIQSIDDNNIILYSEGDRYDPLFLLEQQMIYLEPRSIFDSAIVQADPVVYDFDLLIDTMIKAYNWNREESIEWYCYNIEPLKHYSGLKIIGE